VSDSLIQIPIEEEGRPFFDAAEDGRLVIQRCTACGRLRFPPRPMCPWCHLTGRRWDEMSGRGTIWSHLVPHPPLRPPFDSRAPYNVVVVAIDDDPLIRLVGNVVVDHRTDGLVLEDPTHLRIGASVTVAFPRVSDEPRLARWVLTDPERGETARASEP